MLVRDIRDQLLDKTPFPLILHLLLIILPHRNANDVVLGDIPLSLKGIGPSGRKPNFHRAEGPPPNSMGQESQDLERRCTLGIPPSFLFFCPPLFLNDQVLRSQQERRNRLVRGFALKRGSYGRNTGEIGRKRTLAEVRCESHP